jgi:hypothetical protein
MGMTEEERASLSLYPWMESRIPAIDAVVVFVPDSPEPDPAISRMVERCISRWYPVEGGHRVLIASESDSYRPPGSSIESGAWDHEDCESCDKRISAMTLCYVTAPGQPYFRLCSDCFDRYVGKSALISEEDLLG